MAQLSETAVVWLNRCDLKDLQPLVVSTEESFLSHTRRSPSTLRSFEMDF